MWFLVAILAGLASATDRVALHIGLRERGYSVLLYTFVYEALIALFILPFALGAEFAVSSNLVGLVLQVGAWTLATILGFSAQRSAGVAVTTIVSRLRMIWIVPLAFLFLGESLSGVGFVGLFLVFGGFVVLFWGGEVKMGRGIYLTFLGSILAAVGAFANAFLVRSGMSVQIVSLSMVYGQAMAVMMIWVVHNFYHKNFKARVQVSFWIVVAAFVESWAVMGVNFAYKLGPATGVTAVFLAMSIVTVWMGILFLHERRNMKKLAISSIVVAIGTILLKGP